MFVCLFYFTNLSFCCRQYPILSMSTLLESRLHHHRVRVLSRRARESEVFEDDTPNRRLVRLSTLTNPHSSLAGNDEGFFLTRRQRSQKEHWERERNLQQVCVFPTLAIRRAHYIFRQSLPETRVKRYMLLSPT